MKVSYRIAAVVLTLSLLLPVVGGFASLSARAEEGAPLVVFTEVCFNSTYKANDQGVSETSDVFEYAEFCNRSDSPVSLEGITLQISTKGYGGSFRTDRVLPVREAGDRMLEPGEMAVITVFSGDTFNAGLRYDTEEERVAYYKAYTDFYKCGDLISEDRFFIAPAKVSATGEAIDGAFNLANSTEKAVLRLVGGDGTTLCEVAYNATEWNRNSYALNLTYRPGGHDGHPLASRPLNLGGCTPGALRDNQLSVEGMAPVGETTPVKVMEYNICATDSTQTDTDGSAITMDERITHIFKAIESYAPDVLGLCEINHLWIERLKDELTPEGGRYAGYGRSSLGATYGAKRYNRETWDLYNLLVWNTEKYDLIDSGTFWCSSTPNKPNTFTWPDGTVGDFARAINWVILEERTTGAQFFFLCAHIDAKVAKARNYSATFILEQATEIAAGLPIIMVGDWNANEKSDAYKILTGDGFADARYRTPDPAAMTLYGTGNSWGKNIEPKSVAAIDHCIITPHNVFAEAATVDVCFMDEANTLVGADHNAIILDLQITVQRAFEPETEMPTEPVTEVPTEPATSPSDETAPPPSDESTDASLPDTETVPEENPTEPSTDVPEETSATAGGCTSGIGASALLLLLGGARLLYRRKD